MLRRLPLPHATLQAKYNYFKLLDGQTNDLIQAESRDTYQQDGLIEYIIVYFGIL